jgi:hypothetical protein
LTSARTCPEKRRSLIAPTSRLATGVLQKKRLKPYRFAAQFGFDSVFDDSFLLRNSGSSYIRNRQSLSELLVL